MRLRMHSRFFQARAALILWLLVAALLLSATPALAQSQSCAICGVNLVKNGDAEDPGQEAVTSLLDPQIKPVGWTVTGPLSVARYDSGEFADDYGPGPASRGSRHFYGGPGAGASSATQTIDLTAAMDQIDVSGVKFYLSGYLGKLAGDLDTQLTSLTVNFTGTDEAGKPFSLVVKVNGPPTWEQTNKPGYLALCTATGFVPKGARKADITLDLARYDGSMNGYAADNISLVLTTEPMDGVNLVVNGDFEAPWEENTPVPGWNSHTACAAGKYGDWKGFPLYQNTTDPVPANPGKFLLYCMTVMPQALAFQTIDLTGKKDLIDRTGSPVVYDFSGWLGGYQQDPDTTTLTLIFYGEPAQDGSRPVLKTEVLGPVTPQDRNGQTGLWLRSAKGAVPFGTRSLLVTLKFDRLRTDVEDMLSYADNVALVLSMDPDIKINSIVNSASSAGGPVAPGEMVSLAVSGINLTGTTYFAFDSSGRIATSLGGVAVYFDDTPAPLLYVKTGDLGAVIPFNVDGKSSVTVRVEFQGRKSADYPWDAAPTAPGIFTQDGSAGYVINTENWQLNSASNPAARGSVVSIIWTGGGQMNPSRTDVRIEIGNPSVPVAAVSATIDGRDAKVLGAGNVPFSWTGLLLAEVRIPDDADVTKPLPLVLKAGNATGNTVTIWAR